MSHNSTAHNEIQTNRRHNIRSDSAAIYTPSNSWYDPTQTNPYLNAVSQYIEHFIFARLNVTNLYIQLCPYVTQIRARQNRFGAGFCSLSIASTYATQSTLDVQLRTTEQLFTVYHTEREGNRIHTKITTTTTLVIKTTNYNKVGW